MESILQSIKQRTSRFLADPMLTPIEMVQKVVAFHWTIGSVISIVLLTLLAYTLNAHIIGHYGVVLLILYSIDIPLFRKHSYNIYQSFFLAAIIISTFIFILIFGGYANSAGLVFVGLTCVMSSTLNRSTRAAVLLFLLYVSSIIGLAILNPYLIKHPDITPSINFTFFIINTIWMSGAMMFFIFQYLNERNKFQVLETNKLLELDKMKNELFTNITHEFRTPITIIDGMATQLNEQRIQTKTAVQMIRTQSWRLLNLVNQILDLARIDNSSMQMDMMQSDVMEFLQQQAENFQSSMKAKGIDYFISMNPSKVMMDFDRAKLEAIFINLISNAQKFTNTGGAVSIKVAKKDKVLLIEVEDTGVGISASDQSRIFDRFYQVKTNQYKGGNGIGLTIVKEFTNLLKGQIEFESTEGIGSRFQIVLPISTEASIQHGLDVGKNSGMTFSKYAITDVDEKPILLIVDDNLDIIQYLQVLLNDNYQVVIAKSGFEGFEKAKKEVPDIILSDIMMPGLDGFGFLQKLKAEVTTSHIPVLMLTAKTDRKSKLESLELGAEAYLEKPFDQEELFIRLRKLLDLRKVLHERYQQLDLGRLQFDNSVDIEDQFIKNINAIVDRHLDNEHFNIPKLCREIGMSHTQLYRKFAAVTDIPVNKYIKRYRLHQARKLIQTTSLNISQIAIEVGMPNLAYFSRVFTEEFQINPSKVRRSERAL